MLLSEKSLITRFRISLSGSSDDEGIMGAQKSHGSQNLSVVRISKFCHLFFLMQFSDFVESASSLIRSRNDMMMVSCCGEDDDDVVYTS